MGKVDGKVAFITGAARGQGRSHAVRLAEEGADIIAVDICADVATVGYPLGTVEELEETAELVRATGRSAVTCVADVRSQQELDAAVRAGLAGFESIDIVSANAGIVSYGTVCEMTDDTWQDTIDINLTGVWRTIKATAPSMIAAGRGGSIIITSSTGGLKGFPNVSHYSTAKHGLTGLMKSAAAELGAHGIRVNTLNPTNVNTLMFHNPTTYGSYRADVGDPSMDDVAEAARLNNVLGIPWTEPIDVSNALLWLASDESRYVTGVVLPVDAGATLR
jgi:(+)-trans-carveol dehydrogenase